MSTTATNTYIWISAALIVWLVTDKVRERADKEYRRGLKLVSVVVPDLIRLAGIVGAGICIVRIDDQFFVRVLSALAVLAIAKHTSNWLDYYGRVLKWRDPLSSLHRMYQWNPEEQQSEQTLRDARKLMRQVGDVVLKASNHYDSEHCRRLSGLLEEADRQYDDRGFDQFGVNKYGATRTESIFLDRTSD